MKKHDYTLLTRDSLQIQGQIQVQSEEADKDTPQMLIKRKKE